MTQPAVMEPQPTPGPDKQEMVRLYRLTLLIRRFEESLERKYREGKIGGYLHRYDGQEALVVGIIPLLRLPGDYVLSTYRDHAHALACGVDPNAIMAELLGKATGCAGGKGGSMHLIGPERGFMGGDGIVGGPVPISVGVGWACKYRGGDDLCVCYFGDGAMNQGGVHEALNMAGLYKLPILYVLENNLYAMGTSLQRSTAQTDLAAKARAHGIHAETAEAMDVLAVREVAERALRRIRETGEPFFLELKCYRFAGHGVADNTQQQRFYRTQEEIEEWRQRDPLQRLHDDLRARGMLTDEQEEAVEQDVRDVVAAAIRFAEESPEPPVDSLTENVFA